MRIVYCLNSIRYLGGIQRVTIVKANALAEIVGNEIYIIVTDNKKGYLVHPLSSKVHLIDLDVNYYQNDWKSRWYVLHEILIKRKVHKKRLSKVLYQIKPDIVISVGQSEKYLLPSIKGDWASIREMHFTKNYRMLYAHSLKDKIMAFCSDLYDYYYKIKQYDHIVVLTNEDKENNWNGNNRLSVIPNPLSFSRTSIAPLKEKRIVAVGRLSRQKNYISLIRAFRLVAGRHPDWILEIYGEGEERGLLQNMIVQLNLNSNVFLRGYTSQVQEKIQHASCFVFSSLFEGFGLAIVEAMSCGIPVVSYACPCGPKDIITDGKDGFLVSVNDEKTLAEKLSYMIEHESRRMEMGKAAKEKSERYTLEYIISVWMGLFKSLIKKQQYE
ncbi:glycosyltransferase family 4 protein [uncultured Parabacteroides sp.]|uniref:glycosyltransferase family 4 protein n=1 Tax=uncultured Parabacteroides sp. TaxID=512312 RepID=UPI002610AAA3|nr:glycosyltransferase family 4 protein [uncultured Parabacteroides sp.]